MGERKCCILGCGKKIGGPENIVLYRLPSIRKEGPTEERITSLRQDIWLSRVENPAHRSIRVCSRHFVNGIQTFFLYFTAGM